MSRRILLDLRSVVLALACLCCLGLSVRSVRYVGGQYLPTHNGKFALLAALLALLFVLVRVRARMLARAERRGFPVLPPNVP